MIWHSIRKIHWSQKLLIKMAGCCSFPILVHCGHTCTNGRWLKSHFFRNLPLVLFSKTASYLSTGYLKISLCVSWRGTLYWQVSKDSLQTVPGIADPAAAVKNLPHNLSIPSIAVAITANVWEVWAFEIYKKIKLFKILRTIEEIWLLD
jgi:hypothetical protein